MEIIFTCGMKGHADKCRVTQLGNMYVVIGATGAHIEGIVRSSGSLQSKILQETFHLVEIGSSKPRIGHICYFNHFPTPSFSEFSY